VWLMIFVTHIRFRKSAAPIGSYVGAAMLIAIFASTWWVPGLRSTILAGGPWLAVLAVGYRFSRAR